MLNHIDDAKRLRRRWRSSARAALYDLGRVLDETSRSSPGRYFRQTLVTTAHHANARWASATTSVNWITEIVTATMQLGTHLDALSHLQIGDRGYNGWTRRRPRRRRRRRRGSASRRSRRSSPAAGWSTSPAAARPGRRDRRSTTSAGLDRRARRRGALPHRLGRALGRPRDATSPASPGPGSSWPSGSPTRGVALTGCDTWSYGPVPAEDPDAARSRSPRPSTSATASSSSRTSTPAALAADGVREFALILTHPKLRGATGAWTSPIALV